jgi:hypothetical protein
MQQHGWIPYSSWKMDRKQVIFPGNEAGGIAERRIRRK